MGTSTSKMVTKTPRERPLPVRRRRTNAADWDGTYGHGAGRVHPCVETTRCRYCKSPPGELCTGPYGPKLSTHVYRRQDYAAGREQGAPRPRPRNVAGVLRQTHERLSGAVARGELPLSPSEQALLFFSVGAAWARASDEEQARRRRR